MPQHDWNIANQLFPPTRADLNNALLSAATNSSGTTAPSVPLACQWWADTTNNVMKFRNTANDAWIDLFQLTDGVIVQPVTVEAVPVGTIVPWPGLTAPAKWHLLDGSVLTRVDYPGLFNVLGTRFNTGGETTAQFRLPDMRGRTVVGRDNMGGTAAGRVTVGVSGVNGQTIGGTGGHQALQAHDHPASISNFTPTLNDPGHLHGLPGNVVAGLNTGGWPGGSPGFYSFAGSTTSVASTGITLTPANPTVTASSRGAGSGQNMMPCMVHNWIIFTGGVGAEGDGGGGTAEPTLSALTVQEFACGDETTTIVETGVVLRKRIPWDFIATDARIYVNSGCTTGTLTVSATIEVSGVPTALFATNPTIDAGERTSKTAVVQPVLGVTDIADDSELVVSVTGFGDATAYGLKFILYGYRVIN